MGHSAQIFSLAFILAIVQHQALAMDTQQLLTDLAAKINQARSLPSEAKPSFNCPSELEKLAGIPLAAINAVLPKANFSHANSQSYFLTGPRLLGQRGGGFLEITFFFDVDGKVERVTCNYSR